MTDLQHEELNKALKILEDAGFNLVKQEDILQEIKSNPNDKQGRLFLGGEELSANREQNLKHEAKMIMETEFFKLFLAAVRNAAINKIAFNGKNWDDVYFGKALLFEDTIFRTMVSGLANRETRVDKIEKKG